MATGRPAFAWSPATPVGGPNLEGMRWPAGSEARPASRGTTSDEIFDRFAMAGTAEQVADRAAFLLDAGARRSEFGSPHGLNELEGIRLLGEQILPCLPRDVRQTMARQPA